MSKPNNQLTKTCISCKLQKPLSAFLEMAGQLGARYGNVCASCRKTHAEKKTQKKDDETTTSTSGKKVDSKAKAHGDITKKENKMRLDRTYHEDREKLGEKQIEKVLKTEQIEKAEKKHRFETRSSLWGNKKDVAARPVETREAAQARIATEYGIQQTQTIETVQKQEQSAKEQQKLDSIDISLGSSQTGEQKYKTAEFFKNVRALFGINSSLIDRAEKVATQNAKRQQEARRGNEPAAEPDKPSENIRNKWKP